MPLRSLIILALVFCTASACAQGSDAGQRVAAVDVTRADSIRIAGDSLVTRADSLVRAGRDWRATRLLAGRLAAPDFRDVS